MDLHQRDSLKNEKKEKGEGWGGERGRGEERRGLRQNYTLKPVRATKSCKKKRRS